MMKFRRLTTALILSSALVAGPIAMAQAPKPAPIAQLAKAVDIPYQSFTLDNGLRVIVHEDHKAPVVAVSIWYRVGSKHEPAGKTGFAHLFEHLMFNGSENAPNDYFEPLQQVGATDFNGTTWLDRTNYYQTVPTGALDLALFLESDRMGHLLGAVTQEKLDNQRGVVQNEKRQSDNQPYGLLWYELAENLFPKGHPYRHSTIGSMADLNSATLDDAHKWFHDHYGPNNAVLVLAGDIDAATAKQKVQRWFGEIPRGLEVKAPATSVPTLPAPVFKQLTDMIPADTVYEAWTAPGLNDPDIPALEMGLMVLGGLSSSRFDNHLVRNNAVAVSASAAIELFEDASLILLQAVARDGVDSEQLAKRLDEEVAAFLQNGPTRDELDRAVTSYLAPAIALMERVGGDGKAAILAEGALYSNDPGFYAARMQQYASVTPEAVKAAMNKWMSRPVLKLSYKPGERTEGGELRGGAVSGDRPMRARPAYYQDPERAQADSGVASASAAAPAQVSHIADRSKFPEVQELTALDFPDIERGKLANGMELVLARRAAAPVVQVAVSFDAGYAADPRDALGTQTLMLQLMDEGTKSLNSVQFAEAKERLGVSIQGSASADDTVISMRALKPNLAASFDLLSDYIRNPAFDPTELERVRGQLIVSLRDELTQPMRAAQRVLNPALYGPNHPYGIPPSGLGTEVSLRALTRDDVVNFHNYWLRPDNARIFVVGDTTLKEATQMLNRSFGKWKAPSAPLPVKNFDVALPQNGSRILLVDRPGAPQSVILAGRVMDMAGKDVSETVRVANDVLGGTFLARINMNLREEKGWSYGTQTFFSGVKDRVSWMAYAAVQADKTAASIQELRKEMHSFLDEKGATAGEVDRIIAGNIRELPGRFETTGAVLGGVRDIVKFGRADNYFETLPAQYEDLTPQKVDEEARKYLTDKDLTYVVVGDAKIVRPQLEALDLPVESVSLSN